MNYQGTSGPDTLDQSALNLSSGDAILGLGGNDTISAVDLNMIGGPGDDRLVGKGVWATATYWFAPQGVNVNLQTGVAQDGEGGTDTLVDIHVVHGSSFNDTLTGSAGDDVLHGHGGSDTLDGAGGFDSAQFIFSDPSGYLFEWDETAGGLRVTDVRTSDGDDGNLLLIDIERMTFSGAGRESQVLNTSLFRPSAWELVGSQSFHVGDGAVPRHAVGDFNGDGVQDLFTHFSPAAAFSANLPAAAPVLFWTPNASGAYAVQHGVIEAASPILSSEIVAADLNGDGIVDPVIFAAGRDPYINGIPTSPDGGYPGEQPYIWVSDDGSQELHAASLPSTFGHHGAAGDIDGDGDIDLYVSSISSGSKTPYLLINDGDGHFTVDRASLPDAVTDNTIVVQQTFQGGAPRVWTENRFTASAMLDADGDGSLDLALLPIAGSGAARVYLNDGEGNFSDDDQWVLPASPYGVGVAQRETPSGPILFDGPNYLDTAVLDFNRDGKMDLVAVVVENRATADEWTFYRGTTVQFFQNTGSGFIDVTAQRTDFEHDVTGNQWHYDQIEIADVDQDGFADLLVQRGTDGLPFASTRILHNNGAGFFADRTIEAGVDDGILIPVDPETGLLLSMRNTHVLGYNGTIADVMIDVDTMQFDFAGGRDYFTGAIVQAAVLTSTQAGRWLHGTEASNSLTLSSGDEKAWGYGGADTLRGMGGNDTLDGGDGLDVALYAGARSTHTVGAQGATVSGSASGSDTLIGIERIAFDDLKLAFDLSGHAGWVAKLLGAVFGPDAIGNEDYAGIGLSVADAGMSYLQLAELAVNARLGAGASNADLVNLLYTNVVGSPPDDASRQTFVSLIETGGFTKASLTVLAADTGLNAENVGLSALAVSGLEYV